MSSLRASSIALSDSTLASASDCWRPFSTMPARRSATALSWATSDGLKTAALFGLDVEHADGLVVPGERHAEHGRHEAALVEAADPQEARIGLDVGDHQRLAMGRHGAGHAFAERDPRPADLEAVEAVGRGQRQVRSVPVEQVERGDIGMEGVARPVDDRLEQLVPGARGRGQARDIVDELQLIELVGRGHRAPVRSARRRAGAVSPDERFRPTEPGGRAFRSVVRSAAIVVTIQG